MKSTPPPPSVSAAEHAKLAAIDRAVALGDEGVPALLDLLTEKSWMVRRGVVAGLASLGAVAIPGLVDVLLHRRDDEARIAAAVDALSASSGPASAAATQLAGSKDPAVVCDAAAVLGRRRESSAVPLLGRLALGTDDNVAVGAIEALGRIGGSGALGSLAEAAQSGNFFRVFPAIDTLGRTGDPRSIAPLAALLEQPLYALEAARALGRTGESAAVAPLARLLVRQGSTSLRTFALAFAELRTRAVARHGTARAVIEALAAVASSAGLQRRVHEGLDEADPPERAALCVVMGALGDDESIARLTTLVDSPDPVGPAASKALAEVGRDADEQLLRLLDEADGARRLVVLPLVARASSSEAVARCLSDADPAVRALACEVLARIGATSQVEKIFELLSDAGTPVVQAAIAAIQSLGAPATEKRALELATSENLGVRRAALRILSYFGYRSAFESLRVATRDPDPRIREVSIQGLGLMDDERAKTTLIELSRDPVERLRASAMKALGNQAREPDVAAILREGLADPDAWVRYYACQSLGKSRAVEEASGVAVLLRDDAGQVRIAAIEALSAIGGALSLSRLIETTRSEDDDLRRAALIGLGMTRHESALPTLTEAASSSDPTTRLIAVAALSNFDATRPSGQHGDVLRALLRAVEDPAETVRTSAIGFLRARSDAETATALIDLLRRPESPEWIVATLASPVSGRVRAIASALTTADEALAEHLVSALARMGTVEALTALFEVMSLPAVPARKVAATTFGALRTPDALEVLRHAASSDPDPEVQRIATLLLQG